MVEYFTEQIDLNKVFDSLADPTRRDILKRVAKKELSVNAVAEPYKLTLAAVSKHLKVLEKAKLIHKRREGNYHFVVLSPPPLKEASKYLKQYQKLWEDRFDRLDKILENETSRRVRQAQGKKSKLLKVNPAFTHKNELRRGKEKYNDKK
jgi:DNA-binding transcriptional ArsR family regulator